MVTKFVYPLSINPKCNKPPSEMIKSQVGTSCQGLQPLSQESGGAWENVGLDNDSVISWGDINPKYTPNRTRYYNTIGSRSGSYATPTPFTVTGWRDLDSVPSSAKIKKISVYYSWGIVRYVKGNHTLNQFHEPGSFKSAQVILNIKGQQLSATGPGPTKVTTKNGYTYSFNELDGEKIADLQNVTNFTMGDLKNSQLTFIPGKNTASDISRIVMRHLRLYVEYEDIPAAFNISSLNVDREDVTNCPNDKSTVKILLKNDTVTSDKTEININGSGIKNASISNIIKDTNDTFTKNEDGTITWKVDKFKGERGISFDVTYSQSGKYKIVAEIRKNAGPSSRKEVSINVNSCKPVFDFQFLDSDKNISNKFKYSSLDPETVYFKLSLNKSQTLDHNENLQINTDELIFDDNAWEVFADDNTNNSVSIQKNNSTYTFSNIKNYKNIVIIGKTILDTSGLYNITGKYNNSSKSDWGAQKSYKIEVKGVTLGKDYFKLRVEDGSDIKYNSLMVSKGDDLLTPLTYTTEEIDKYISNMDIYGETKRIPVNETQYVSFTINLNTEKEVELKNVLAYIEVHNKDYNADDIIVGVGEGVKLLKTDEAYICSIDSVSSKKPTIVKLAVSSSIEIEDVVIKIKPYNFDGYTDEIGWVPCHVMFKDIPNIKISIEGISDLSYCEKDPNKKDTFWLYYKVQNLSNIDAKKVRFQLKEPHQFKKLCYIFEQENDCEDTYGGNDDAWFNKNNRIITFENLEANSAERVLAVKYQATKRGIYDFVIHTLDSSDNLIDDQYKNSYKHNLMVNIPSDVRITTSISKSLPRTNELVDYNIKVKNLHKKQKTFVFDIFDIGSYDIEHSTNDYIIEPNGIRCSYGDFNPSNEGNKIGTWMLNDIGANKEYSLSLSLRPQDVGNHVIKTVFTNQIETICEDDTSIVKDFYNEVKVIEPDKQLEFNVYHAISEDDIPCDDCDKLTEVCDDDFINLGDNIYYVFEIKNNSRNKVDNTLHVYARLPKSFLKNGILCSSRNYLLNQSSNLISFSIPELPGCQHEDSTIKFCIKVKPEEVGSFTTNFSLSTRNSSVLHKQLKLTVDTEFNNRQLEHEIKIYNFDKTNKYYRYEIDDIGNIFKFFNTGDKTLRPIRSEKFKKKSVEVFRGSNLREIVEQIKDNSKYVDPLLLRTGSNKLADKGYELFPDGLIRRFGLLNSEVYHYSGQFPITKDLVDKAMKWDIDTWDTKVWAGDRYDNGIFSLAVDYTKVPTNFNILDVDNPIKNLQNLVDNSKPYGTRAICHYAATVRANIQISLDKIINKIKHDIDLNLHLPDDFTLVSFYNRFDDTVEAHYDLIKHSLKMEIEQLRSCISNNDSGAGEVSSRISEVSTHIFADKIKKIKTEDCYDLIADTYRTNTQPKNIDIVKPFDENYDVTLDTSSLYNAQIIETHDTIEDRKSFGFEIKPYRDTRIYTHDNTDDRDNLNNNIIRCVYTRNDIEDFTGFKLIVNNNVIQERNINDNIHSINIQIQSCINDNNNILHFWGSINHEQYYHIGLCILDNDFKQPLCNVYNDNSYAYNRYSIAQANDANISFKISDKIKTLHKKHDIIKAIEKDNKWQYLKNINKNNKYAYFENKTNIDPECKIKKINIPKIALKYDNINISDLDEIVDIQFKIDAQTNKNNFADDININLYRDGDKYIPKNNIGRQMHYPSLITNVNQEFLANMEIEQDNLTICSECLKTSLGHHSTCQYCGSSNVYYTNEKTPATACYNCDWITKGWHDYCPHCLSYDIEKIKIDYNKTYCNNCGALSPDYYEHCPQCFSSDVTHLTNNVNRYSIFGEDKQNIEPIIIHNADVETLNIFSLYIPFNYNTSELKQLSYLNLKVHGTNHNDGKYYYCEACNSGGVGNYDVCPYCGSKLIHNESISAYAIEPYYYTCDSYVGYRDIDSIGEECKVKTNYTPIEFNSSIPAGEFVQEIDLMKCAEHNYIDKFKLTFVLENQQYKQIANKISKLPIKDEYQAEILEAISLVDISIDNLSLDYKYKNEHEWVGLDKLEYDNHTGISYHTSPYNNKSDVISFKSFNIEKKQYKRALLYISGFLKNISNDVIMNVKVNNNGEINRFSTTIHDTLFTYNNNILKDSDEYIGDISVEISFSNVKDVGEIVITDCNIITEWGQYEDVIHNNVNKISSKCVNKNNSYLFKSLDNNLWGLKDTQPYYLSGKQLDTNLIGYIDFGKLNLEEYIRLYSIEMIVSYKSKNGNLVTDVISAKEEDNTFKSILKGVGYTDEEINDIISNNISLDTALKSKGKYINGVDVEQLLSGDIESINGELWGEITYPDDVVTLNNLEYKVSNINKDGELVNDIPLYYKIAQSFNTGNDVTSIDTLYIDYFGKIGYPSDIINVYICDDNNGKPGNIIANNKVQTNNISEVLNVDLNVNNLQPNTQYWFVLEDVSANSNNYHRFYYNDNLQYGQLLTYTDEHYTYEPYALSFGVSSIRKNKIFYDLPTTWIFYIDDFDGYKIHYNLYRYNIEDSSSVSLSNFLIKSGYKITDV